MQKKPTNRWFEEEFEPIENTPYIIAATNWNKDMCVIPENKAIYHGRVCLWGVCFGQHFLSHFKNLLNTGQ